MNSASRSVISCGGGIARAITGTSRRLSYFLFANRRKDGLQYFLARGDGQQVRVFQAADVLLCYRPDAPDLVTNLVRSQQPRRDRSDDLVPGGTGTGQLRPQRMSDEGAAAAHGIVDHGRRRSATCGITPGCHFWPLQWIEGGCLLALSALLVAIAVWLAHRRAA
jgi:hypothetical protein